MEQEGKIDIHNRKEQYELALKCLDKDELVSQKNKELILKFLKDCEDGKTLRNRQRKKIGISRLNRLLDLLKNFAKWFNKSFEEVTQTDLDKIISDLEKDIFKKKNGMNFSQSSKAYYKKSFKKFNKWLQENKINTSLDCGLFETYEIMKEVEAITKEEVEKMISQTGSIMNKTMLAFLFDSGARAEEFLNIRIKHLSQREDKYFVRIEFSKTMPRTIILPIASPYIQQWIKEHPNTNNSESLLFPLSYDALRMFITRTGKKVLNKHISPHTLRHSSASYYCNILNQYQLCKRYGWSMSSKMPARYIDRNGVLEGEIAEKVENNEIQKIKKENQKLQEEIVFLKERLNSIEKALTDRAKEQQSPVFLQTSLGQEAYSISGIQLPFQKFTEI